MIKRFSLYGFFKNQQYYEPFIVLIFLEKGLSFTTIGLLIGFRELFKIIFEIPSGAIADLYGRRKTMITSFVFYIASFVLFAMADFLPLLFIAMFCFSIGEAFRTGTHKAMIFDWLKKHNQLNERTKIYGYTRSWSKTGSATSALLAAVFIYFSESYSSVFLLCVFPYLLNIFNLASYPAFLDQKETKPSLKKAWYLSIVVAKQCVFTKSLRTLILESMTLEGIFKVSKDYIQPILIAVSLTIPFFEDQKNLNSTSTNAILVGAVYALYFLIMSITSRHAHFAAKKLGGEKKLTRFLWFITVVNFAFIGVAIYLNLPGSAVIGFFIMAVVQNLFRPSQISRIDEVSDSNAGATVLSVESQSKSLFAAILAPAIGFAVDIYQTNSLGNIKSFLPVAFAGMVISLIVLLTIRRHK